MSSPRLGAVINAGYHQIGTEGQKAVDAHVDTVGGRAVNGVKAIPQFEYPQGRIEGQGVADGASFAIRRHDRHISQCVQRRCQGLDAGGVNAVVVGNHDMHEWVRPRLLGA